MIDIVFQICSETVLFLYATAILCDGAPSPLPPVPLPFCVAAFANIRRSILFVQLPSFSFILHLFGDRGWVRRP